MYVSYYKALQHPVEFYIYTGKLECICYVLSTIPTIINILVLI